MALFIKGVVRFSQQKLSRGIKLCLKAKETAIKNRFRQNIIALTYDRIGKAFFGLEMHDSVISNCRITVNNPRAMNLYPDLLVNAYKMLYDTYDKKEMKDSADKYKLLYLHLSDSIFNRRKFNAARDIIVKYEDNKVQSHIFNLNDRIHFQNIWIIIAMCVLIAALAIAAIIHVNNRRLLSANELLISKNKDLLSQANESQRLREKLVKLYEQIEQYKSNAENSAESIEELSQKPDSANPACSSTIEISEQQMVVLLRDITRVMQDTDIISDSSFSLTQLAQKVHSNTTYVSAVINKSYQKNFKTYLNEHRIQLAAQRLLDNDSLTIQAIAESAGFKSASNFITAFKKVMGMNPSTYRKHKGFQPSPES